jgi:hypothetical protein
MRVCQQRALTSKKQHLTAAVPDLNVLACILSKGPVHKRAGKSKKQNPTASHAEASLFKKAWESSVVCMYCMHCMYWMYCHVLSCKHQTKVTKTSSTCASSQLAASSPVHRDVQTVHRTPQRMPRPHLATATLMACLSPSCAGLASYPRRDAVERLPRLS